jgi:hypothetical protein
MITQMCYNRFMRNNKISKKDNTTSRIIKKRDTKKAKFVSHKKAWNNI